MHPLSLSHTPSTAPLHTARVAGVSRDWKPASLPFTFTSAMGPARSPRHIVGPMCVGCVPDFLSPTSYERPSAEAGATARLDARGAAAQSKNPRAAAPSRLGAHGGSRRRSGRRRASCLERPRRTQRPLPLVVCTGHAGGRAGEWGGVAGSASCVCFQHGAPGCVRRRAAAHIAA